MTLVENLVFVFIAGLITAIATGIGALPFFLVDDISDRWTVALWGLASGIMVAASVFGLINEGLSYADGGVPVLIIAGFVIGVVLVEVSDRFLDSLNFGSEEETASDEDGHSHDEHALEAEAFAEGDVRKLALILGILTVHSFPEGVAIGVSFAELGLDGGLPILGLSVPVLAVFMTIAISIHNIPEGLAISFPMQAMGASKWRMVGAAIFSSLPQPIGAVIAFVFVRMAQELLPLGFGFAAGAMIYLVVTEFLPEALEEGEHLPSNGYTEVAAGTVAGVGLMIPFLFV